MLDKFYTVIKHLIGTDQREVSPSGINIIEQFDPIYSEGSNTEAALNAAFLILLSGESHPLYTSAEGFLSRAEIMPEWKSSAAFYRKGLELISGEITSLYIEDVQFRNALDDLYASIDNSDKRIHPSSLEKMQKVFFPEGLSAINRDLNIQKLRKKRTVQITSLNQSPVSDPLNQIVFTSNILLTTPIADMGNDMFSEIKDLNKKLNSALKEDQLFWYDHPIPIGIAPESNEILYGLEGLDRAVAFEKDLGTIDKQAKLLCLLSVSVTHRGLQKIAKQYIEHELNNEKNIRHIDVYVFTEADTERIIRDVLIPAAETYGDRTDTAHLKSVFGVDGEYGRHYSFLKSIAAFWQVFIDPDVRGTFKIDLDQIFPQEALIKQTGVPAFEHFKTPLWGAQGIDSNGNAVELGMLAGALVNQRDIDHSLFYPDVPFPSGPATADKLVFDSQLPQALSTEAEMMTRYSDGELDGKKQCLQRIHVTGGTNGILLDALRRHRPFTPSIIGRAEDQAYILSVLFNDSEGMLRYVHKDGLIMRHDKEAFAGEAIKKAAPGKLIGDYIRILLFSYYCRALPWSFDRIKNEIDPFTGCFVSKIPMTIVYLRFALNTASLFSDTSEEARSLGREVMQRGIQRLGSTIAYLSQTDTPLAYQYDKEKKGWDMFYDLLDKIEQDLVHKSAVAAQIKNSAESIIETCKVHI